MEKLGSPISQPEQEPSGRSPRAPSAGTVTQQVSEAEKRLLDMSRQLREYQQGQLQLLEVSRTNSEAHLQAEARLGSSLQASRSLLNEFTEECNKCHTGLQDLARDRAAAEAEAQRHQEAVQTYAEELRRSHADIEAKEREVARLNQEAAQLRVTNLKLSKTVSEQAPQQEALSPRLKGLLGNACSGLSTWQSKQSELISGYESLRSENRAREGEAKTLRASLEACEAECARMQGECGALQAKVTDLEGLQVQATRSEVARLHDELAEERETKEHLQRSFEATETALSKLIQEGEELKVQMNSRLCAMDEAESFDSKPPAEHSREAFLMQQVQELRVQLVQAQDAEQAASQQPSERAAKRPGREAELERQVVDLSQRLHTSEEKLSVIMECKQKCEAWEELPHVDSTLSHKSLHDQNRALKLEVKELREKMVVQLDGRSETMRTCIDKMREYEDIILAHASKRAGDEGPPRGGEDQQKELDAARRDLARARTTEQRRADEIATLQKSLKDSQQLAMTLTREKQDLIDDRKGRRPASPPKPLNDEARDASDALKNAMEILPLLVKTNLGLQSEVNLLQDLLKNQLSEDQLAKVSELKAKLAKEKETLVFAQELYVNQIKAAGKDDEVTARLLKDKVDLLLGTASPTNPSQVKEDEKTAAKEVAQAPEPAAADDKPPSRIRSNPFWAADHRGSPSEARRALQTEAAKATPPTAGSVELKTGSPANKTAAPRPARLLTPEREEVGREQPEETSPRNPITQVPAPRWSPTGSAKAAQSSSPVNAAKEADIPATTASDTAAKPVKDEKAEVLRGVDEAAARMSVETSLPIPSFDASGPPDEVRVKSWSDESQEKPNDGAALDQLFVDERTPEVRVPARVEASAAQTPKETIAEPVVVHAPKRSLTQETTATRLTPPSARIPMRTRSPTGGDSRSGSPRAKYSGAPRPGSPRYRAPTPENAQATAEAPPTELKQSTAPAEVLVDSPPREGRSNSVASLASVPASPSAVMRPRGPNTLSPASFANAPDVRRSTSLSRALKQDKQLRGRSPSASPSPSVF